MIKDPTRIKFVIYFIVLLFLVASCSTVDFVFKNSNNSSDLIQSKDEISLLTYNIKAIYEKEESQINNLLSFVNREKVDFVVFQELFDESTRDIIIEKVDPEFTTIISRVDYNSFPEFFFQDAGLFMMSRYPRVDLSNIDFGDDIKNSNGVIHMILEKEFSSTNDFLANKSILGALFNINETTQLFLFTAHVQAAGSTEHKQFQLSQIKNFIDLAIKRVTKSQGRNYSKDLIVLLAGDFNSNAYDTDRFIQFRKLLGYPRDLHKEFHGRVEEYTFRNRERRYDYILSYDKVADIGLKRISVKSINVENILDDDGESISDHRGIKATILLNQKEHKEGEELTKYNLKDSIK